MTNDHDTPATFSVTLTTTGAAFYAHNYDEEDHDENAAARNPYEVINALKAIAEAVERGDTYGPTVDSNGNRAGFWNWS